MLAGNVTGSLVLSSVGEYIKPAILVKILTDKSFFFFFFFRFCKFFFFTVFVVVVFVVIVIVIVILIVYGIVVQLCAMPKLSYYIDLQILIGEIPQNVTELGKVCRLARLSHLSISLARSALVRACLTMYNAVSALFFLCLSKHLD